MVQIFGIFSREVLGSKSVTLALVALVMAVVITAVALFLFAFTGAVAGQNSGTTWSINFGSISILLRILVFTLFLFAFMSIWFFLYVQYNREAEDIYSRLREKLVGTWSVQYELAPGQNQNDPLERVPVVLCDIEVAPETKKLEIHFDIRNHPFFQNGQQVIQTIALRHEHENKYSMSYYYRMVQPLNPIIAQHLLSEDGKGHRTELDIEIFATLTFDDVRAKKTIDQISGQWFDLNGNLIRLFSLVSELQEHARDDRIFQKKLSDATIHRDNFAALMGDITFSR